jgi:hypothetical protein
MEKPVYLKVFKTSNRSLLWLVLLENQAKELLREASSMGLLVMLKVSLLLLFQSFVVYSPDLSLTIS